MARLVAERGDVVPHLAELFREHGYGGTSLSLITAHTGLGKGSLYHFFPGGKSEMAEAVLESIQDWFEDNIFVPLMERQDSHEAIDEMFTAVSDYFRSGRRVCLVGAMALGSSRDPFAEQISVYFRDWVASLASALSRCGTPKEEAGHNSLEIVVGIQGAIVLSRATGDSSVFEETISSLRLRFLPPL